MIRINLLTAERRTVKAAGAAYLVVMFIKDRWGKKD